MHPSKKVVRRAHLILPIVKMEKNPLYGKFQVRYACLLLCKHTLLVTTPTQKVFLRGILASAATYMHPHLKVGNGAHHRQSNATLHESRKRLHYVGKNKVPFYYLKIRYVPSGYLLIVDNRQKQIVASILPPPSSTDGIVNCKLYLPA